MRLTPSRPKPKAKLTPEQAEAAYDREINAAVYAEFIERWNARRYGPRNPTRCDNAYDVFKW
jgi:hypothetical protein